MGALSLESLEKSGGFVDQTLVKFHKSWKQFDEESKQVIDYDGDFFVKKGSYADFVRARQLSTESGLLFDALLVSACIRLGEKGEQQMTYEKACSCDAGLFGAFLEAVNEVYNGAKADPKHSAPMTSSGVKSSSRASAGAQSRKRKSA